LIPPNGNGGATTTTTTTTTTASKANCQSLLVNYPVWGYTARGVDLSQFTNREFKWMGCLNGRSSCKADSFYCTDGPDTLEWGSKDTSSYGTMRAVLGNEIITSMEAGCCGWSAGPSEAPGHCLLNSPDKNADVQALCQQLGFASGTVERVSNNGCPEVHWDGISWTHDSVRSIGYGRVFRCTGTMIAVPLLPVSKGQPASPLLPPSRGQPASPLLPPSKGQPPRRSQEVKRVTAAALHSTTAMPTVTMTFIVSECDCSELSRCNCVECIVQCKNKRSTGDCRCTRSTCYCSIEVKSESKGQPNRRGGIAQFISNSQGGPPGSDVTRGG